jgi:hypothetical protein
MCNNKGEYMRTYETQYPAMQTEPVGFFGNDFGGSMRRPVLVDYKVVGYLNGQLWLSSKTGDASDSIVINFTVDGYTFNKEWAGKTASFEGSLDYDYSAQKHYYSWACTNRS